jgi:hypothetical protein
MSRKMIKPPKKPLSFLCFVPTGLRFDEVLLIIGTGAGILNELPDSRVAINRAVADPFRIVLYR